MAVINTQGSEFESLITKNEIVLVDFWAEWCAPCKQFAVVYDKVSELYPEIVFAKVNVEQEAELADTFEIRSIPFLMVFKKGILIYAESGSMPESTLIELITQAKVADVSVG